ncbi:hypothetical protein BpHYR1_035353 [Brachionus plicatilis]|uniref:Uncharacterized protein n=1 Tax=Brachionus plicatilis TaxID=10195 RepID=A0A3M7R5B2_BRAPC|nr:hypothetical protein BpHYR1_035353 [Brachionus plicatilis]
MFFYLSSILVSVSPSNLVGIKFLPNWVNYRDIKKKIFYQLRTERVIKRLIVYSNIFPFDSEIIYSFITDGSMNYDDSKEKPVKENSLSDCVPLSISGTPLNYAQNSLFFTKILFCQLDIISLLQPDIKTEVSLFDVCIYHVEVDLLERVVSPSFELEISYLFTLLSFFGFHFILNKVALINRLDS